MHPFIFKIPAKYHWLKLIWRIVLALLVIAYGYLFLKPVLDMNSSKMLLNVFAQRDSEALAKFLLAGGLGNAARVTLAIWLQVMALGLIVRARIAWATCLILIVVLVGFHSWHNLEVQGFLGFAVVLFLLLLSQWQEFSNTNLAASNLFSVLGLLGLLSYTVFGVMSLGTGYSPGITNLSDAFYFSIVTLSTVGYGDIVPHSDAARLFTLSVIVIGISVFAATISVVLGPIVSGTVKHIFRGQISEVMRKNHTILIGRGPMAVSLWTSLKKRNMPVVVILADAENNPYPSTADIIVGDPTDTDTLSKAGIEYANYMVSLLPDDSSNAFVVLAARETAAKKAKLIALVNSPQNVNKIRHANPDMVVSLQALGSEILLRTISGERIDNDAIMSLIFGNSRPADAASSQA